MTARTSIGRARSVRCAFFALTLVPVMASMTGLGGCSQLDDYNYAELGDPKKRHAIGYSARPEALYVELSQGGQGLSPNQHADVWRFVERYKQESTGNLRITAPKGAGGHYAVSSALREVEGIVQESGLDPRAVEVSHVSGVMAHGPAIRLVYDRTIAVGPQCADWGTDLGENRERLPYNDFGCATERNLAMTAANGRDLQHPQEETPRSSERRSATWTKYVGAEASAGSSSSSSGSNSPAPVTPAKP